MRLSVFEQIADTLGQDPVFAATSRCQDKMGTFRGLHNLPLLGERLILIFHLLHRIQHTVDAVEKFFHGRGQPPRICLEAIALAQCGLQLGLPSLHVS